MKTMAEVVADKLGDLDELTDGDGFTYSWFDMERSDLARELADALTAAGYGPVKAATVLIRDLTDPDNCSFDHHGGCQAHGYLDLEIGEMCPQLEAKAWVYNHAANLATP